MFVLVTVVSFVAAALGIGLTATFIASLVALFAVARNGRLRLLGPAVALAAGQNVVVATNLVSGHDWLGVLLFLLGMVTATAATGLTLRTRRMYLTALEDRARRLEVERDQRTRLTAAAERTRVAREMHDIVGHTLSVMVTLADGAATLADRDAEPSAPTLHLLADTGRQAMNELRRVLGALREDHDDANPDAGSQPDLSPQPGIGDLDALLTRVRAAGLPVTYRTAGDLTGLGSGLQLTVYRIVQEALTNTLKHAGTAATAEVSVTAAAGSVDVRITDTGAPADARAAPMPATDGGHGLIGIRERAALYNGTVGIGPRHDHLGWTVDVRLDATIDPANDLTSDLTDDPTSEGPRP
ncbi:signal transduction histidine kinase [Catenulispora sp. EB89]